MVGATGKQTMIDHQNGHSRRALTGFVLSTLLAYFGLEQNSILEQQIAAIREVEARNKAALVEYTWEQQVDILLNDKFQSRQMFQVQMNPDGGTQRMPMSLPDEKLPGDPTNRGVREWLKEKKERVVRVNSEKLRELSESYAQADPDSLRLAFERGNASYEPAGPSARLSIRDYIKPGDSVLLVFSPQTHELQSLEAVSSLGAIKESVHIAAKFTKSDQEPNHIDDITAVDKKTKLSVSIHNLNYQRTPSR